MFFQISKYLDLPVMFLGISKFDYHTVDFLKSPTFGMARLLSSVALVSVVISWKYLF